LHQREQKKLSINKKLNRETVVTHKPFYAAEVVLNEVNLRGISAVFAKPSLVLDVDVDGSEASSLSDPPGLRVSAMPTSESQWFNFDDYVDTDIKPEDRDPWLETHEIGDCPLFLFSRWVTAQRITTEGAGSGMADSRHPEVEASRFGREPTHFCLIGENPGGFGLMTADVGASVDTCPLQVLHPCRKSWSRIE
jgi:hypothetical protein